MANGKFDLYFVGAGVRGVFIVYVPLKLEPHLDYRHPSGR